MVDGVKIVMSSVEKSSNKPRITMETSASLSNYLKGFDTRERHTVKVIDIHGTSYQIKGITTEVPINYYTINVRQRSYIQKQQHIFFLSQHHARGIILLPPPRTHYSITHASFSPSPSALADAFAFISLLTSPTKASTSSFAIGYVCSSAG